MGDIVRAEDIPQELMSNAVYWIDETAPRRFGKNKQGRETAHEVVAAVLFAAGHQVITDDSQAELSQRLDKWLPSDPYERREALDDITWSVLDAMGVKAL